MRLKNKVAIITGGAGGIGLETVRVFVKEGANVLIADLKEEDAKKAAEEFGDSASGHGVDVSDSEGVKAMVDAAVERFGSLDIMVNNAGISIPCGLQDKKIFSNFNTHVAVNQVGVLNGIFHAANKMVELKKHGVIINTTSIYGTMAAEFTFSYNVSKSAVNMMTKGAALELAKHKIRVVGIAPGRVQTPMLEEARELGVWDHMKNEQMRREFTQPVEIANVMAFVASDEGNVLNGSNIACEDGYLSFKYPLE